MRHLCDLPAADRVRLAALLASALRGVEPRERDPLYSRRRSLAVDAIHAADELLDEHDERGAA